MTLHDNLRDKRKKSRLKWECPRTTEDTRCHTCVIVRVSSHALHKRECPCTTEEILVRSSSRVRAEATWQWIRRSPVEA